MKYIISTIFLSLIFCNSSDKNKSIDNKGDDLKIEIINKVINSRFYDKKLNIHNILQYDDFLYDSLPVNKINFKVINEGKEKYVLLISKNLRSSGNIQPIISDGNEELDSNYISFTVQYTSKYLPSKKILLENAIDSINVKLNNKYLKEVTTEEKLAYQRETEYIVIHPGEVKYFTYYLTLPLFQDSETLSFYNYEFEKNKKYFFQLNFKDNLESLKKNLNKNQLKEIEENNYIIFEGDIKSNKVPINFLNF